MKSASKAARAVPEFDAMFLDLARKENAEQRSFDGFVRRETLALAEHLEAFPGMAVEVSPGLFVPPAACHEIYPHLQRRNFATPIVITTAARCARNEPEDERGGLRLPTFTMREVVIFATPARAQSFRRRLARAALALAHEHRIDARLVPATDPFFGGGEGKRLFQKIKELKLELRAPGSGGEEIAIASFNLHEEFFTRRFQIGFDDGAVMHSACAAFGLERWADAWSAAAVDGSMPW